LVIVPITFAATLIGSHIAQMAIVFGLAFVVYEVMSVLR